MNHIPKPFRNCLAILLLILVTACSSGRENRSLDFTLLQYEKVVRWSQWDGAMDFVAPEYLKEHPVSALDMDRLRLFRITQYNVRSMLPGGDGQVVNQTVEIRMFNRNRAVEQVLIDRQEWRYDETLERWFLHSGLPDVTRAR